MSMNKRVPELPTLPPPPGAMKALISGFNSIAGNAGLILFPVLFDVFLWLGPRLKADGLIQPLMDSIPDIKSQLPADQFQLFTQYFTEFRNGLNLFTVTRTMPLGVFSLMSTSLSTSTPLGSREAVGSTSFLVVFGSILLLTVIGWIFGSLFFRSVANAALKQTEKPGVFRTVLHGVLLSGLWMLLIILSYLPIIIIVFLVSMLDGIIKTILLIILSIPAAWILLMIYYSFFGIFSNSQNAISSTRTSIRLLRYGLPPLGWFTMLVILISQVMDMLWRAAPADSWMMGVGIFGHAFVSTSLLAASFIYFRELNSWIETALEWVQQQKKSSAQV